MIVGEGDCGANGRMGVCTRCCDVVPVVGGRCGNAGGEPAHSERRVRAQAWTPTKNHVVVVLQTPGAGFCRCCRTVVEVGRKTGRPVCLRRRWGGLQPPCAQAGF